MYCVKCGKEIKNATAFCPYCGDKIMNKNTMVNSNGVKEYNDFSRDMVIALFIGICNSSCNIIDLFFYNF